MSRSRGYFINGNGFLFFYLARHFTRVYRAIKMVDEIKIVRFNGIFALGEENLLPRMTIQLTVYEEGGGR